MRFVKAHRQSLLNISFVFFLLNALEASGESPNFAQPTILYGARKHRVFATSGRKSKMSGVNRGQK